MISSANTVCNTSRAACGCVTCKKDDEKLQWFVTSLLSAKVFLDIQNPELIIIIHTQKHLESTIPLVLMQRCQLHGLWMIFTKFCHKTLDGAC